MPTNNNKIIGIHCGHNATVCLLENGKIISCISEERFTNKKNQHGFPHNTVDYLKKEYLKNNLDEINVLAIPGNYFSPQVGVENINTKTLFNYLHSFIWGIFTRFFFYFKSLKNLQFSIYKFYITIFGKRFSRKENEKYQKMLKYNKEKIKNYDHHLCHAAAAYFGSPFNQEKALVLTLDGESDLVCATVNIAENRAIKRIAETNLSNSMGIIYMELTRYLGMKPNEHEFKVMGLAPYAKEKDVNKLYNKIKDWIVIKKDNPLVFETKFDTHSAYFYIKKYLEGWRFDIIAGAFQKLIEERIIEWIKNCIKTTNIHKICLGGGVFMNVKANLKISKLPEVEDMFVFPSCSDESNAIGAAYLGYIDSVGMTNIPPISDIYFGPSFEDKDIEEVLTENIRQKYKTEKIDDIEEKIADLLAQNKIVARLAGRMEFGARALGNRSILANPKYQNNIRIINEQMKNRDFWMPFACTILKEREKDYLINPKKINAHYMMAAFPSTKKSRRDLKCGMHPYDFTIRPQVLEKEYNPKYYKIIKKFEEKTGIGGVLNTSFNLHGFPIVLGPKEAIFAFKNSGLQYLAIENYLLIKESIYDRRKTAENKHRSLKLQRKTLSDSLHKITA